MNFLEKIISLKKAAVDEAKTVLTPSELSSLVADVRPKNDFKEAITRSRDGRVKVIAEIKRSSPSKGVIAESIDPVSVAKDYVLGKASAVSVLTETSFFNGSIRDFQIVREAVPGMPLLRKDFIIDEYQIYESLLIGADAILLIVAILDRERIKRFLSVARERGLNALVEVHREEELEVALSSGADIVGVNNRDLASFEVSPEVSERLSKQIPRDVISVSESGIRDTGGLEIAAELGYHAVLIGEHFMRAKDRVAELTKFTQSSPQVRARK
ncbi:MAG: indole-3-glycerol phosphate synthase TrpC [Bacteroidetes bacterium]|nr:indole-3-glycerol phosphate synthase TrpC [Bacteroidota bacterium]